MAPWPTLAFGRVPLDKVATQLEGPTIDAAKALINHTAPEWSIPIPRAAGEWLLSIPGIVWGWATAHALAVDNGLRQHPYIALLISSVIFFPGIVFAIPAIFCAVCCPILSALGFAVGGILSGSLAAAFQSAQYGATVPAGGLFAALQSMGATTKITLSVVVSNWVFLTLWLLAGAVGSYVLFGILL